MIGNKSVHYVESYLYNWLLTIISAIECVAPVPPGNGQMIGNKCVHYIESYLYNWLLTIVSAIECAGPVPPGNGQIIKMNVFTMLNLFFIIDY